ncbi:HAD family phosphatase [Adlercreutzia sp. ZJ138]|uniref:HAD family hydrolase n=1 Tax=Adlercreutzia sp. ZJ138 TaxID=2709405 RepID=UPI0013EA0EB6|nr:HAD-IB family hydrolase [Adlercreutzia sp. ZJ138]
MISDAPVRLAVFDFDGTSIRGNSPVLLVRHLVRKRMLPPSVVVRILLWAVAYKLRLPQNESWVRCLVFRAFARKPVREVDQFLRDFYDSTVERRFRTQADEAMHQHTEAGEVVVVVSATFEPLVLRAMESHSFQYQISTRMKVAADETYTNEVEGLPVEGARKLSAVREFANAQFGEDGWKLAFAYGDHHSDRSILQAAETAYAVNPDRPLARMARRCGWPVLRWR